MSKSNTFENDLLQLIFNATAIANIADNAASSPLTQLFVALHTADPGETGVQNTSETAYTGYARVAVNRNSGAWTVTVAGSPTVSNLPLSKPSQMKSGWVAYAGPAVSAPRSVSPPSASSASVLLNVCPLCWLVMVTIPRSRSAALAVRCRRR